MATPETAYIVVADDDVDQICEDRKTASREARTLRAIGCQVRIITAAWADQDAAVDKILLLP